MPQSTRPTGSARKRASGADASPKPKATSPESTRSCPGGYLAGEYLKALLAWPAARLRVAWARRKVRQAERAERRLAAGERGKDRRGDPLGFWVDLVRPHARETP